MAVARERSRLVPLKAVPTGNPTRLANALTEIPPAITVDGIRPVSTVPAICSRALISSRKNGSISDNLFNQYDCGSYGAVGFKSG